MKEDSMQSEYEDILFPNCVFDDKEPAEMLRLQGSTSAKMSPEVRLSRDITILGKFPDYSHPISSAVPVIIIIIYNDTLFIGKFIFHKHQFFKGIMLAQPIAKRVYLM